MESDESLHELMGVRMAPASDTPSTSGLAPCKGSSTDLRPRVNPCQGSSLSIFFPAHPSPHKLERSLKTSHKNLNHLSYMLTSQLDISQRKIFYYTVFDNAPSLIRSILLYTVNWKCVYSLCYTIIGRESTLLSHI